MTEPLRFHEAAGIFPLMAEEDLEGLADSIEKDGQQCPVELYGGKIIDGRNRYIACQRRGIEPLVVEVDLRGRSPTDYVVALNLHRRHLSESQRAMVAARMQEHYAREAKERQRQHGDTAPGRPSEKNTCGKFATSVSPEREPTAREKAGAAVNVSGRSVSHAAKVISQGAAELIAAVERGEVAVSTAARLAGLPRSRQRRAVSRGPRAVRRAAPTQQEPVADASVSFALYKALQLSGRHVGSIRQSCGGFGGLLAHPRWDAGDTGRIRQMAASLIDDLLELEQALKRPSPAAPSKVPPPGARSEPGEGSATKPHGDRGDSPAQPA